MSRIKVGFIGPCVGVGGADMFMMSMIQQSLNLEFTGIATYHPSRIDQIEFARTYVPNVPIYEFEHGQARIPTVQYLPNLTETCYAACKDADIIISWCQPNLKECLASLNKPVIEIAQNSDEVAKTICHQNDEEVDFRVAVSKTAMRAFPEHRQASIAVIYNGISADRVTPRVGREGTRKSLGIKDNEKLITYMGRYVKEKYPEALIQALTKLPSEYRGLYVGRGKLENHLFDEAARHLAPGRVIFAQPQRHVGDVLQASDAFMLVSDFEGMPLAVLEAWLAGIPTVVSDMEPMMELQEQMGSLSTYVPRRANSEQLAQGVLRATSERDEVYEEIGKARNLMWDSFTISKITAIWENYVNDCLHKYRRQKSFVKGFMTPAPVPMKGVNDV